MAAERATYRCPPPGYDALTGTNTLDQHVCRSCTDPRGQVRRRQRRQRHFSAVVSLSGERCFQKRPEPHKPSASVRLLKFLQRSEKRQSQTAVRTFCCSIRRACIVGHGGMCNCIRRLQFERGRINSDVQGRTRRGTCYNPVH